MTNFELIKMNIVTLQSTVNAVMKLGQQQFVKDADTDCGSTRIKVWQRACIQLQEMQKIAGELVASINVIEELPDATD